MWNLFFSKFCGLLFFYFSHFIFNFVYLYFSTNSRNFYVFLFYGLEILSKNFGKSWNIFLKKYRHLKSKILHKFHRLLFVFFLIFMQFSNLFFSYFTYLNLWKNYKQFCGALLYGLQILSENYGKLLNFYLKK